MTYRCSICGKTHEGLPDLGFRWPDPYFGVPESEREARIKATTDVCAIDDEDFFIRGVIQIPIKGQNESFGLGVWVSQKRENYQTYLDNFDTADIGPFFGWLCNRIAFYEVNTWAHPTTAHFQGKGLRPLIRPEPSTHPLFKDFSDGVTMDRAWSIVHSSGGAGDT